MKRCLLINNNKLEYLLKRLFTHDRMNDIHTSNEYTEDELRSIELFNENFKIYQHDPINHVTDYSTDYMRESKHILLNDLKKILKEKDDIGTKYIMEVGLNRRQNPVLPKKSFPNHKKGPNSLQKTATTRQCKSQSRLHDKNNRYDRKRYYFKNWFSQPNSTGINRNRIYISTTQ